MSFIFENAPRKVLTRVASALAHFIRAEKLQEIDEEMGAIRLIAAEEELVVAIFEWLKLHPEAFPNTEILFASSETIRLSWHSTPLSFNSDS